MISDGEDFGENTSQYVEEIQDSSIKLFTLGIGTNKGSNIISSTGIIKKDKNGQNVVTKLNSNSLKKIALSTNGRYYEITNEKNEIKLLINDISKIKGDVRDVKQIDTSKNKYFYFLFIALILLMIDFMFNFKALKI